MEEPEEPDSDEPELQPFDWERVLRWLLVIAVALWVLGGAVETIVLAYFTVDGGFLATGSESSGHVAAAVYKVSTVVGSISFRTWIGAGALLIFLWYRNRMRGAQP